MIRVTPSFALRPGLPKKNNHIKIAKKTPLRRRGRPHQGHHGWENGEEEWDIDEMVREDQKDIDEVGRGGEWEEWEERAQEEPSMTAEAADSKGAQHVDRSIGGRNVDDGIGATVSVRREEWEVGKGKGNGGRG